MRYMTAIILMLIFASVVETSAFLPYSVTSAHRRTSLWLGQVDEQIQQRVLQGFQISPVGETDGVSTEWVVEVDGIVADLGPFSKTIFSQIMRDAKTQRFQGFRPGVIPPHLERTYRAYCMSEVAREVVMEAMDQSKIRPFTDARSDMSIEDVSFVLTSAKSTKKKKKKGGGKSPNGSMEVKKETETDELGRVAASSVDGDNNNSYNDGADSTTEALQLLRCKTLDDAITAGWKPGEPFSFIATNVRGQRLVKPDDMKGARPIGRM